MAERNNTAKVHHMSLPPDFDNNDGSEPPHGTSGGGDGRPAKAKRKKKVDTGKLQTLFRRWVLQFTSQIVWDTETRKPYSIAGLRNQYGNDEVRMWMQSDKRRDVHEDQIVFDPSGKCGPECINLFGGFEMVPMKGVFAPITELLLHLVDHNEEVMEWVLDWIAYPLQNPGAKMPTSIIMHGDEGSGKNLFWEIVQAIYGEYGSVVGQDQLESKFNDYLSKKLFIIGDEVLSRQEMRHLKGKLKAMISGKTLQIETKMMPVRPEANHVNLVFLSNELQPNALDASDRRHLVVWTPPKRERSWYQAIVNCAESGGREAFYYGMLHRDLSKFDPFAPPPVTEAKTALIDLGRPNPERFYLAWQAGDLPIPYASCAASQAYRAYKRWALMQGEKFTSAANYFSRQVLREARDSVSVKKCRLGLASGQTVNLWCVTPPPEGVNMGVFAGECVESFEAQLAKYLGDQN